MNQSASTSEGRFSDLARQLAIIWIKVKNLLYSQAEGREELFATPTAFAAALDNV